MGKPSVATLFGYCLGAGLELPLGCTFRLAASDGAQIGLPELELGTTPAWRGSARLARCVGREHALDKILRSKKIPRDASDARRAARQQRHDSRGTTCTSSSIVSLARAFGLETIAEGIEDEEALTLLRAEGVDFAQGFRLGPSGPIRDS